MEFLWEGLLSITWQQLLMYVVGGLLIWLAIEKGFDQLIQQTSTTKRLLPYEMKAD